MNPLQQLIKKYPFGFPDTVLPEVIKLDRLFLLLVRYSRGRFLAPAQDVPFLIEAITKTGEYIRDVSFPQGAFDQARRWTKPDQELFAFVPPTATPTPGPNETPFNEADCGGVFDGINTVTSDADPGL